MEKEFFEAIKMGDLARVNALLNEFPELLDKMDENGETPLNLAILHQHPAIGKLLLDKGANPNKPGGPDQNTALYVAVLKNSSKIDKAFIELLLDRGGNPTLRNAHKQTMLALDVEPEISKLLFTRSESFINELIKIKRQKKLNNELLIAVFSQNLENVKKFLQEGANPYYTDDNGLSALSRAIENGEHEIAALIYRNMLDNPQEEDEMSSKIRIAKEAAHMLGFGGMFDIEKVSERGTLCINLEGYYISYCLFSSQHRQRLPCQIGTRF